MLKDPVRTPILSCSRRLSDEFVLVFESKGKEVKEAVWIHNR